MRRVLRTLLVALLLSLSIPRASWADPITIDFDSVADLSSVGTSFSGLTFLNATILTAGVSLNELEFPPISGSNVIFDDGGAISVFFDGPISSVSAYLTYLTAVTLTAFDEFDNVLGQVTSLHTANIALSGAPNSSPNELLQLSSLPGISYVTFSGDLLGGSFVLDNLTYDAAAPVPEPGTITLVGLGVVALLARRSMRARRTAT